MPDVKRIQKEDFDKDDQAVAEKLAYPLNSFMEQVRSAFQKNIDFTNLNMELITFTTEVDSDSLPKSELKFRSTLNTNVAGNIVISAVNLDSTATITGAPFLTTSQNGEIVTVSHITGLPANLKFRLIVLSIGR